MKRFASLAASALLVAAMASTALAGIQVTTCVDLGDGVWRYTFFACAPNIDANDLHVRLTQAEIMQGEEVVGCGVPNLAGFSCNFTPTEASYFFPTIGPFDCVYVSPDTVHQFRATGKEPLGFLCVVDRRRDRPVPVAPEEAGGELAPRS